MNPVQNVGQAFLNLLYQILSAIPVILAFLLILGVGYLAARALRTLAARLLDRIGFDRSLHENAYARYAERISPGASPTRLIAGLVFWFVMLGALSVAIAYTGNPGLISFLEGIYGYLPKLVAAVLIFVVAGIVSTAASAFVDRTMGDTATGQVVQAVVPVLVMGLAIFMILDQLEIAPDVVRIGFTALVGGLVLALALAFGLGGREVAAEIVRDAYERGRERREEVRRDVDLGRERGRDEVERAKSRARAEDPAADDPAMSAPGDDEGEDPDATQRMPPPRPRS